MSNERKVAVVTGGSSGIGRETALSLTQQGCIVYELSRRDHPPYGVHHITADVTDEEQVNKAIDEIISHEGQIDILINVIRAVLPHMRQRKCGRIVCVSSIAGILPIPFQLWYSVSKAAIAAYVLALQNEIRPYGITVCAVLPGDIATGFTDARQKDDCDNSDYSERVRRSVAVMERDERGGMSPKKAGEYIAKLAIKKKSRPLKAIGFSYKAVAALTKLLPRRLSNYIVGKIYAK